MHQMVATTCKALVTPAVLDKSFTLGFSFRFVGIDSISIFPRAGWKAGKSAFSQSGPWSTSDTEGVREFKCVKESEGWKLFRDVEWMARLSRTSSGLGIHRASSY